MNKIIYFDRETISNILQEMNKGTKSIQTGVTTSTKGSGEIEMGAKVSLGVPFFERLSFFFSGKLAMSYIIQKDKTTTITSTEISEFEKLRSDFEEMKNIQILDIENSSTFLRVAGGYLKMLKGGVEGVDTKEFKSVMDSYDGYDTYKTNQGDYVRFNNSAFVSNYKRNDLLTTKMDLYCVLIGEFDKEKFDFIQQVTKMENLITGVNKAQPLSSIYPLDTNTTDVKQTTALKDETSIGQNIKNGIKLFDVVYASVPFGGSNDK